MPYSPMQPITREQSQKLTDSPSAARARRLLSARRLWKYTDRLDEEDLLEKRDKRLHTVPPGHAGAYVLDDKSEPHMVLWNGNEWSCECGSDLPCVHLAALLIHLAEKRPEDSSLALLLDGDEANKIENPGGLFDDTRLNPQQDLLFFIEPDVVEKKAILVLGTQSDAAAVLDSKLLPIMSHSESDDFVLKFTDMSGTPWILRPALISLREDGSSGMPRAWVTGGPAAPALPGPDDFGTGLMRLLDSDNPPVNPRGEPWRFEQADKVRLRFEPLLSSANDEPAYEPVVDFLTKKKSLHGGLVAAGQNLLILDGNNASSAAIEKSGNYIWFLRLILSRKVLGASDIRARFTEKRSIPEEIQVELPDLPEALKTLTPRLVLEVSGKGNITDFHPGWRYKDVHISPGKKGDVVMDNGGNDSRGVSPGRQHRSRPLGLRNRAIEEKLLNQAEEILSADLSWQRGRYSRMAGDASIPLRLDLPLSEVLSKYGGALIGMGVEIRLEDRPVRKGGALRIQVRRDCDILELNTCIESDTENTSFDLDEWLEKGGLVRTREAYFTLTDKALEQLVFLKSHGMEDSGFLSTSPDNLSLIDAVYSEIEASEETIIDLKRKRSIYRSLNSFNPEKYPHPPDGFLATLRPYQIHGYAWLLHLKEKKLGGCLADDMGLGKTVQTLAYLSRLKADGKLGPSLIVGPVVTLTNWEAEIRRFSPTLNSHRYSGPAGKRIIPGNDAEVDLIIVSYQTLRNDIEKFLDRDWDHIILDEAHYVKNASSRTFKAVRSLKASHRLSLTGTPWENHLNELWSQMSFLNPGLLGSQGQFIQRYVRPVERDGNDGALSRLSETVAPFILRRKKSEVLDDLPPKDESVLYCDMTSDQAEAYHCMRNLYFQQVTGLLSDKNPDGSGRSRIEIFSILSKLRLLAIHPPLAGEQFEHVSSGKMTLLDNLMEEILEEDHKTLVFSQFLGALDRAQDTCRRHGWRYSRLTGSTRNRDVPISQFQEDPDTKVFLLSLRAGGVGINLTAADYVILLDPWWNPAVEAQAVDRAHRMGQTRPVMAYRLITAGTIEEKVLELQEKKKNLIAGVLGDGSIPKLTDDEILKLFE